MTSMQAITGETFVKSLPVMFVSGTHKRGKPPYIVCPPPPPPSLNHITTKVKFISMTVKKFRR